jgi:hypothetical protein
MIAGRHGVDGRHIPILGPSDLEVNSCQWVNCSGVHLSFPTIVSYSLYCRIEIEIEEVQVLLTVLLVRYSDGLVFTFDRRFLIFKQL